MTGWKQASIEWDRFLRDVLAAREQVGCRRRSAWFRGTKRDKFDLTPTLHRKVQTLGQTLAHSNNRTLYSILSEPPARRDPILTRWRESSSFSAQYKRVARAIAGDIAAMATPLNLSAEAHSDDPSVLGSLNSLGAFLQEIDAFHEFKNRAQMFSASSWSTLASMRHYGIPVRLLDWSESFVAALYFALDDELRKLVKFWSDRREWNRDGLPPLPGSEFPTEDRALWILNPFHLAQLSGIHGAIPYPDLAPLPDYYSSLLVEKSWPFKRPLPLHADKTSARIESQRGHFTVHGYCPDPLNVQIFGSHDQLDVKDKSNVLAKVKISRLAAIYGCFFLWQFVNFDEFEIYRDFDSLGRVISDRYF